MWWSHGSGERWRGGAAPCECSHGRRRWEGGLAWVQLSWLNLSTCCSDRRKGVNIFMRNAFYARLFAPKHPSTQHAAEISMAELHAAVLDRAAVRSS